MNEAELLDVLALVSEDDGAYGWCQLDRELVRSGRLGLHVGRALEVLLGRGLVRADGDPKTATARYRVTQAGATALKRRDESSRDYRTGIDGLRAHFEGLGHWQSANAPQLALLRLLLSRVTRAIGEGMPLLEGECSRRSLVLPRSDTFWTDAALIHALEIDLAREDDTSLRWVAISYWVVLCNFEGIAANVEALAPSSLDDVIWLVAGALWVQSASGQPTTYELREALGRLRARCPGLDGYLAAAVAGPAAPSREAAEIARRLLLDAAATLPMG